MSRYDDINDGLRKADYYADNLLECLNNGNSTLDDIYQAAVLAGRFGNAAQRLPRWLSPGLVSVGDGVTICHYSDRDACTIIEVKKNGKQLIVQHDTAIRDPGWKPDFHPGGFCGHTSNNSSQRWLTTRNPSGTTKTANWSEKRQRYFVGGVKGSKVGPGRHHFYDYNF